MIKHSTFNDVVNLKIKKKEYDQILSQEEFEDTKEVIRIRVWKNRQHNHSMGTCATQLTRLRKVCGNVTVSDHRLSKPEGFNVSFYVYMW